MLPALVGLCLAASFTDIKTGTIPNALNGTALALGLILSGALGGTAVLVQSLAGALLGLAILIVPFLLHMVGAGDVKFLAAAGAIVGWRILLPSFLVGAALGAAAGIMLMAASGRSLSGVRRTLVLIHSGAWLRRSPRGPGIAAGSADVMLPYAVPLSAGLVTVTTLRILL